MKYLKLTDSGYELKIDSSFPLPNGCLELSEDDYDKLASSKFAYKDGAIVPYVAPAPEPVIPSIVSMRQARLALLQSGLLSTVSAAIAAGGESDQIEWEYATEVNRNQPLVQNMKSGLNLSDADLDNLFTLAASL